ncbi:MAG TPA: hypothetical protein VGP04_01175 [Pseudonocardiaceae bacterium]|nr:hypothetical protein [Pseudonocardiaceae bacterium]
MSEHSPDALSGGFDGTESPAPLPDPSGRDGWRDAPDLPPFTLPPLPNTRLMREAVAAVLGEDPTRLLGQDPGAAPAPQPAGQPNAPQANVAPPTVAPATVAEPTVAQPTVAQRSVAPANITAPLPRPAPQAGGPRSAGAPSRNPRPAIPTPVPSAAPPPRRSGGLRSRYRPPLAAGSRTPVQLGDLRRRIDRPRPSMPLQTHSNGGAGLFFAISFILFVVLAYGVVSGIVDAIARLLP